MAESSDGPVTVVEPDASLIAALDTGLLELEDELELGLLEDEEDEDEAEDFFAASALAFSLSRSFKACILASFSLSPSEGLAEDDELEDVLGREELEPEDELDEEAAELLEDELAGGVGFSSCETSWIEKNSRSRNPSDLLTVGLISLTYFKTKRDSRRLMPMIMARHLVLHSFCFSLHSGNQSTILTYARNTRALGLTDPRLPSAWLPRPS